MSDAGVIWRHLDALISRFRLTGELDQPDPLVCRAAEHPVWWAELQRCWTSAAEMKPRDRDLALLRLRVGVLSYVRVVERVDEDAAAAAAVAEPVDLADLRRRVAAAHPDRGGDAEEFRRLHEEYRAARGRVGEQSQVGNDHRHRAGDQADVALASRGGVGGEGAVWLSVDGMPGDFCPDPTAREPWGWEDVGHRIVGVHNIRVIEGDDNAVRRRRGACCATTDAAAETALFLLQP